MYFMTFDKFVFTDEALTTSADGPFKVSSTTELPKNIYFRPGAEYVGIGESAAGNKLWTVRFKYPDHVVNNTISIETGAVYDE